MKTLADELGHSIYVYAWVTLHHFIKNKNNSKPRYPKKIFNVQKLILIMWT